ncbi:unnamed protein product [Moneuplotes crassus]|uniref:Uncharacterized protein n=2 Tax=Euplotes crassus TaxID=5936 RepID=A0AAD1UBS9_EUPCR|nr:unnamed protein product [Moneuplotes crassus]
MGYFNIVFNGIRLRECAKLAAKDLKIPSEDLKNFIIQHDSTHRAHKRAKTNYNSRSGFSRDQAYFDSMIDSSPLKNNVIRKIKLVAEQILEKGYHNPPDCGCEVANQNLNKRKIKPLNMRRTTAASNRAHLDHQNNTLEQTDFLEGKKSEGFFLTDIASKYPQNTRRNPSSKPEGSRRSGRMPSEKIIANQRVTFLTKPEDVSLQENKSFNLVKCRQRLKELTDSRMRNLLKKKEKREKQLEKFYKSQRKQEKGKIAIQLKKEEHRQIIFQSYKNKIKQLEDKSLNEYRSQVRQSRKRMKKEYQNFTKSRHSTGFANYYTQDTRIYASDAEKNLEAYNQKQRLAEQRITNNLEKVSSKARKATENVPKISEKKSLIDLQKEERQQIEFVKLHRKNASSYRRKETLMKKMRENHKLNLSMRIEKSKSIKNYNDQEFSHWQGKLQSQYLKDLKKIKQKKEQLDNNVENLKEVNTLRFCVMQNNFKREQRRSQHRKNRLLDREINNRERVQKIHQQKQATIENQMEINRIVREQAQMINFH